MSTTDETTTVPSAVPTAGERPARSLSRGHLVARGIQIGLALAWMLVRYAALRLSVLVTSDDDTVGLCEREHLRGRLLRETLEGLGATFIKLGQVMSTRPDLFSPEIIAELEALQDDLPRFGDARRIVERELGPRAPRLASMDEEPVAAASVAQVHRGVLEDGREVAIKILRPEIRLLAERDGAILHAFASVLMRSSEAARHAELVEHLDHFLEGIVAQTDLRIEAENYRRFRKNFRRFKKLRFPEVVEELSGERVLVMDFVRGEKIQRSHAERFPDLADRLREAFLKMCFEDGFLHADLHPGNFVVQEDGSICIFDVGLTKSLSEDALEYYIDFNRCLAFGTTADFMHHLRTYHRYIEGTVDWVELERDIAEFAREFRAMSAKDLEFRVLIDRVFATGRKHGVRPRPEMTLMMVGLVTAEGIGKQLAPDVNSFQEVTNYLIPVLARRGMLSDETIARLAESALASG
ncbi:MAG: ABC1 kinase family protein [Deltaproteobacteria bacterium]